MPCKIIQLSENSTAIVCGHKDHECDDKGPELVFDSNGKYYETKDHPEYTPENPDSWTEWMMERNICGGCCSCSICGTPSSPDPFMF